MRSRGFSLIELLIVVAIILIIAAIAIPNLIRSRIAANEASAVSSLRMLNNAEVTYALSYGSGYPDTLTRLGAPTGGAMASPANADLLDPILSGNGPGGTPTSFVKAGYLFNYYPIGGTFPNVGSYQITSDPIIRGSSGGKSFFTNEPLLIRANASGPAGVSDPPL
jgi:prepilin-type N-terminal cleavage/methylation domain-containing protein